MAEIQVSQQVMRDKATQLNKIKGNITNYTAEVKKEITTMKTGWEGTAAEKFVTKFNGLEDDFNNIYAVIDQYAQFLSNAADEWDATNATIESKEEELIS